MSCYEREITDDYFFFELDKKLGVRQEFTIVECRAFLKIISAFAEFEDIDLSNHCIQILEKILSNFTQVLKNERDYFFNFLRPDIVYYSLSDVNTILESSQIPKFLKIRLSLFASQMINYYLGKVNQKASGFQGKESEAIGEYVMKEMSQFDQNIQQFQVKE